MNNYYDILILLLSILGLWWGAVWVVESASRIAVRLGISEIVVGLTIVAFGTSAPEFAVTLTAAVRGLPDISIGNVIGSNIYNLGFILGGVALIKSISTSRTLVFRDGSLLIGTSILLLIFLSDLKMERWEGLVLFCILIAYLIFLFSRKESIDEEIPSGSFHWYEIPRLITGLALIIAGGLFLVTSSTSLARSFGISEWVIGVTIVAIGTSAPEFVTSLVAVNRGKHGISAGNLIGSNIFNLLGVLGLASLLRPMTVDSGAFGSIILLTGLAAAVVIIMRTGWRISRLEGALLILINLSALFFILR